MDSNWLVFWLGISAFVTAIMAVFTNAGGNVVLLAVMANVLPPPVVVPLHGVVMTTTSLSRAAMFWRGIDLHFVVIFALGSVIGSIMGVHVMLHISQCWFQLILAATLFYLALAPKKPGGGIHLPGMPAWLGVGTSFLGMFIGAAGPMISAFLYREGMTKNQILANHGATTGMQGAIKTLVFGIAGFAFGSYLLLLLAMIVAGWLGGIVGAYMVRNLPEAKFQQIVQWTIVALGVRLLWAAAQSV